MMKSSGLLKLFLLTDNPHHQLEIFVLLLHYVLLCFSFKFTSSDTIPALSNSTEYTAEYMELY